MSLPSLARNRCSERRCPFAPILQTRTCRRLRTALYLAGLAWLFYIVLPAHLLGASLLAAGSGADAVLLAAILVPPCALGYWSAMLLADSGEGTPLPIDPTRRLVTCGPYACVRNPMQIAGVSAPLLVGLYRHSPAILAYGGALVLLAALVFQPIEGLQMRRAFGDEYEQYRRRVRNWVPRLRPFREGG